MWQHPCAVEAYQEWVEGAAWLRNRWQEPTDGGMAEPGQAPRATESGLVCSSQVMPTGRCLGPLVPHWRALRVPSTASSPMCS